MMKIFFLPLTVIFFLTAVQCTSTRWTVVDLYSVDERETPEKIGSRFTVLVPDSITAENPYLSLKLYEIRKLEYAQRILVERTVQKYQPKWGFTVLGALGASIAFYAGNTDGLIETRSRSQSMALNSTGILLAAMAFTNMRSVDEPIRTGEIRHLRRSGAVVREDTIPARPVGETQVNVLIRDDEEIKLEETFDSFNGEGIKINLAGLARSDTIRGPAPGEYEVMISHGNEVNRLTVPVSSFMTPVVVVNSPVAELRNEPVYDEQPPLAEIADGSELIFLGQSSERWYEVQFGGSNLFISTESGEIHWRAAEILSDPNVITVEEVPFGEINVEYSVPVLKQGTGSDIGFIFSNHLNNQIGLRRYLDRDYRLMELYYREALGVSSSGIIHRNITENADFDLSLNETGRDSSTVYAYIGGYAQISGSDRDDETVQLVHIDENDQESRVDLNELLARLASLDAGKLVVFLDLEFQHRLSPDRPARGNSGRDLFRETAESVLDLNGNSVLLFSSRPDQASGLFESARSEKNFHHIFPYFIAQALQQRRTVMADLVRHVENQVDYTSRRLHDRSQSVQAFGNLSIDLAD